MKHNELFKIGEVSKLFHISVSILRHYDKIGLVKPEYIDPETGYRYYSTRQFECLNTIRYLRALDMPLEEITAFLQNRNIDTIHALLLKQKEDVKRRQQELMRIERKIEHRLVQMTDALASRLDVIELKSMPSRRLACLKKQLSPKHYLDLEASIRELEQTASAAITFLGKVGIGLSAERLMSGQYKPYELVFIILDDEDQFIGNVLELEAENCVTIRFQGGHDQAPQYYEKLMHYIKTQGLEIAGFSKEITLIDYGLTTHLEQFVTEIQIPVVVNA